MARELQVEAWYFEDDGKDQRLPHKYEPNREVSLDKLSQLGVLQWALDADNYKSDPELQKIRDDRGYSYEDIIEVSPDTLPGYDDKIRTFFEEHIHTDEEIRYVLDGSGYFDVRDENDEWIRISCKKGDMIVLPEGMYHRFTLDDTNYIKAMRLFVGDPIWTPFNRPQEENPSRVKYVKEFLTVQAEGKEAEASEENVAPVENGTAQPPPEKRQKLAEEPGAKTEA